MSRCRSTQKVVPGATLVVSGTRRAVTGCAPLAGAAALAGRAAASAIPRMAADHNARRQEYLKSRKAIAGRIIAEIAAIRGRARPQAEEWPRSPLCVIVARHSQREGRVLTAPHLGTEVWAGFDLQAALAERWHKPVRVMNDADVQGFGAIRGKGVEMVLTLGTGAGTSIFENGRIVPHLELAHHPVRGNKTYDEYIGKAALDGKGSRKWNKRVARVIEILRRLVNFDHLYLGGGN